MAGNKKKLNPKDTLPRVSKDFNYLLTKIYVSALFQQCEEFAGKLKIMGMSLIFQLNFLQKT